MILVKLGGSLLEQEDLRRRTLAAVAATAAGGESLVLLHGGGKRVDRHLGDLGIPRRMHAGLRITDARTLEAVVAVLAGLVNKTLVAELDALGVRAVGISGVDGGTLRTEPHPPVEGVDLGFVGRVTEARPALLRMLAQAGALPVVASVGVGAGGTLFNVNADAAASALAVAAGARRLVFLTDVDGVKDGVGKVLARLDPASARRLLDSDAVTGGMRPKLLAALEAIAGGVPEVVIAGPTHHASALDLGRGGTRLAAA